MLGSPDISGGTYVIFEHSIRAKRSGIDVSIITENYIDPKRLFWHPEANELEWLTIDEVKERTFDIAIATWWRTVYDLYKIDARVYAYFVQSIESRFYHEHDLVLRKLVDSTYMLPLTILTEAKWIQAYLAEHYDLKSHLVPNGIRKDIYLKDTKSYAERIPGRLRVLVEGAMDVPFKNVQRTLELCKKSEADEIWLLTLSPVESYPGVSRIFSNVSIYETPMIYRSCDVIVKLSYVEGMFGPPLEMFHCGGTAITYDVSGYDEYIVHDYNGLVAARDDEDKVISYINRLKCEPELLKRLKAGAVETAGKWPDWAASAQRFRDAVAVITNEDSVKREVLEKKSKFYFEFYTLAVESMERYSHHPVSILVNEVYSKVQKLFKRRF